MRCVIWTKLLMRERNEHVAFRDMAARLPVVPGTKKTLSTLRDSDVERAIGDVLADLDRVESGRRGPRLEP